MNMSGKYSSPLGWRFSSVRPGNANPSSHRPRIIITAMSMSSVPKNG